MGLRQDRSQSAVLHLKLWTFPLVVAVVCGLIGIGGEAARQLLKYDRLAIGSGEWWRLVTGHFAHLGFEHLALNLAGLVLVWVLVGKRASVLAWLIVSVTCVAVIDIGFWYADAQLLWYVGLSGLLHGLLVAGAIVGIKELPGESITILLLVLAKVIYEQMVGPLPGSEASAGGSVVVNAHLYGVIGGILCGPVLWRSAMRDGSI